MENKDLMIEDYLSGTSLGDLARKYGVSRQRIHQIIKKANAVRPSVHFLNRMNFISFFDARRDLVDLLRGRRLSWKEIHNTLSMDLETPKMIEFAIWRRLRGVNQVAGLGPQVICSKCHALKPRDGFHNHHRGPGGLSSVCKSCVQEYQKEHIADYIRRNEEYKKRRKETSV
jgi:predicted DNA-binding protein YlxM (UPF0122 family)